MRVLLAVTGASGAIYAHQAAALIRSSGNELWMVLTGAGRKSVEVELGPQALAELESAADRLFDEHDVAAPPASGSSGADAMLVAPCTLHTAMAISAGLGTNLVERAAQVMLKEGRPLVLLVRETPLASHHLRMLAQLAEAGAVVMPASPFFYTHPSSLEEMARHLVARALSRAGVEIDVPSWEP